MGLGEVMRDLFPPDVLRALEVRRHERAMDALRDSAPPRDDGRDTANSAVSGGEAR